ncbi:MAG: YebG family protein [Rouxiella badensis]|jgi:dsDNA-binding SOS-regulon protein|uniref:YebG family protein n=1 Tax=Rouxiella badensis TaxID=1646377 RepID=UPI00036FE77E|nr:YebG family protein [Rouxiella badensis]QII38821.1 YebG family protein [Rouxiella badensis]
MAVETKFVVVRKGEEKMTFASKKEADAYDKMLDMAEAFSDWLLQSNLELDETQAESMGLFFAEQKEAVQHILRTSKVPDADANAESDKAEIQPAAEQADAENAVSEKKIRAVKAA